MASAEIGMDKSTAKVARMLPRKIRIMRRGEHQPDHAFMEHGIQGLFYENRLVEDDAGLQLLGKIEEIDW